VSLTAVEVAGKMQRQVTEKRSQIDTLQTKIHWLEECMDAAVKVKNRLKYNLYLPSHNFNNITLICSF
jgi:hypothetical protein